MNNDTAVSVLNIVERKMEEINAERKRMIPLCICGCQDEEFDKLTVQYELLLSVCNEWINLGREKC